MTEVIIQGFLGRDAATHEIEKGGRFLSFTVCSNEYVAGKQKDQWFDCVWFDFNDKMAEYLKKGSCVNVVGSLDADLEVGRDGKSYIRRKVTVHHVAFASSSKSKDEAAQTQDEKQTAQEKTGSEVSTDTVPPSDSELSTGSKKQKKVFASEDLTNNDLPF